MLYWVFLLYLYSKLILKTKKMSKEENVFKSVLLVWAVIICAVMYGEVRCIYKAVTCNWEPVGKAEIIYTGASLTGLGAIVGYFDIEDK